MGKVHTHCQSANDPLDPWAYSTFNTFRSIGRSTAPNAGSVRYQQFRRSYSGVLVGRAANCDVNVPHATVSAQHCIVSFGVDASTKDTPATDTSYVTDEEVPAVTVHITDLSTNGTFRNGKRLPKDIAIPLLPDDVITLGIPDTDEAILQGTAAFAYRVGGNEKGTSTHREAACARALADAALKISMSPSIPTPFAVAALQALGNQGGNGRGGKPDDISVVVATIVESLKDCWGTGISRDGYYTELSPQVQHADPLSASSTSPEDLM